ncbi:hypothetical protein P3T27_006833 [Kitasatospora sp. MAA19]|uniref:rhodanese-like domain-containing protein n=1 Tax=Kitasatospora sp. MAA19 TaxID=3035090 RepID=UPI00247EBCD4|nr:hypothetical protein [Kitasatospora sp. MAA19]
MTREIDLDTFAAAWADGGLVLDVREPDEYHAGHVPGALPVPLAKLPTWSGAPAGVRDLRERQPQPGRRRLDACPRRRRPVGRRRHPWLGPRRAPSRRRLASALTWPRAARRTFFRSSHT